MLGCSFSKPKLNQRTPRRFSRASRTPKQETCTQARTNWSSLLNDVCGQGPYHEEVLEHLDSAKCFSEVRSEPAVLALIALVTIILLSVMRITCSLLRLRFQVSASLHHFLERIGLGEDNVTGQVQTVQHDLLLGLQVCKLLLLIVFQFGLLRWRRVCGQRL